MKSSLLLLSLTGLAGVSALSGPWPPSTYTQAQAILSNLTFEEKSRLVYGIPGAYVGVVNTTGILPAPFLNLQDAGNGVGDGVIGVTAWPSELTLTNSWNTSLYYAYGEALGAEHRGKGVHVALAPAFNGLCRNPLDGRQFELGGGEDPYLTGEFAYNLITGIQSNNISATQKHMFLNEVENYRMMLSEVASMDTLVYYMQPFLRAADAWPGFGMSSYSRINGTFSSESPVMNMYYNMTDFKGAIMSDWYGQHSPYGIYYNAMEFPYGFNFGSPLQELILSGNISESVLDMQVMRILSAVIGTGIWDTMIADASNPNINISAVVSTPEHVLLARQIATESTILLENNGLLPLSPSTTKSILFLGDQYTAMGGGSGFVDPSMIVTPFEGVWGFLAGDMSPASYTRSGNCTLLENTYFYYDDDYCWPPPLGADNDSSGVTACQQYCLSDPSCVAFTFDPLLACGNFMGEWGACYLVSNTSNQGEGNGQGVISGLCAGPSPQSGIVGGVNLTFSDSLDPAYITAIADQFDVVVVSLATDSSEGTDRTDLSLPAQHLAALEAAAASSASTVAVVRCPGVCELPWTTPYGSVNAPLKSPKVDATIYQLMPGQEGGNALAQVLFGAEDPSGRLAFSLVQDMNSTWFGNPINPEQYPGVWGPDLYPIVTFLEGIYTGYRFFDSQNQIKPAFPFGYGLSYANFSYSDLSVSGTLSSQSNSTVTVSMSLNNDGAVDGVDVVQLYIVPPSTTNEPPKKLRNFQKQFVSAGSSVTITFSLTTKDVEVFNSDNMQFNVIAGNYGVAIGRHSQDILLSGGFSVTD